MSSNLPPGVSASDIPGNRPEDMESDALLNKIIDDIDKKGYSIEEAHQAWKYGQMLLGMYYDIRRDFNERIGEIEKSVLNMEETIGNAQSEGRI